MRIRTLSRARRRRLGQAISFALVLALIGGAAWFLWPKAPAGPSRKTLIQEITVVPPPPPEPEEVVQEEPEIVEPVEEPEIQKDVETPTDSPSEDPSPAESSEAAGLDRAPDAGSDSFRLAAGRGGGLFGRGGGGGGWEQFVETHMRRALQRDPRTRSAEGFLKVSVTIDPNGRFVAASLRSSTGDPQRDAAINDVLSRMPPLGRGRPPNTDPISVFTLNMKHAVG